MPTRRLTMNITGSVTVDIDEVEIIGSPPDEATTWDPEDVYIGPGGEANFSNGNLTCSSTASGDAGIRSNTSKNSGVRVAKFLLTYAGDPEDEAAGIGLADPQVSVNDGYRYMLFTSGKILGIGPPQELGGPVPSGEHGFVFLDEPAGKVWFDNEDGLYETDREAGTNPHFTFTPGDSFELAGALVADSGTTSITLVDTASFSSGRFGAWDA